MIEEIIKQLPSETPIFVLIAGFLIGFSHAFEPDHIAAMATQNTKILQKTTKRRIHQIRIGAIKSSVLGALWGAGHTSSIILVSMLIFVFSVNIPENIFHNFELGVGAMLVLLGTLVYVKRKSTNMHVHPHVHDEVVHIHPHAHDGVHKHGHKSYLIGCIHGLAGSGSIVILTLSTMHDLGNILSFILVFGTGSIVGMMTISSMIGASLSITPYYERLNKILRYSVSLISIVIGADILYNIMSSWNI